MLLPLACVDAVATVVLIVLTEEGAPTSAIAATAFVGGVRDPEPRRGAADAVARAARPAAGAAPGRVRARLGRDRAAVHRRPARRGGDRRDRVADRRAAALRGVHASGTALFVTRAPSRAWRPDPAAGSHGVLGALRSGGVRTIMVATVPIGFCFGTVEISLPAFASSTAPRAWAGALLSVWAAASAVGGLAYGARTFSTPLPRVYLRLAALLPLGFLPALAAPSVAAMAVLIVPAGLLIAPLGAAGNQLVGEVAPPGAETEAYTWPVTAMLAGFAAGTAVGGVLVEHVDWHACFVAAAASGLIGAALAYAFRRTLAVAQPA